MLFRVNAELIKNAAAQAPYHHTSARKIAAHTGVSKSAVDRILRGRKASIENLGLLARAYQLDLNDCLTKQEVAA